MSELEVMKQEITELLRIYAQSPYAKLIVAPMIAERSLMMHHLYEDLGFKNRVEMGRFMCIHFPRLSEEKPKEKLWKKFLYDRIGKVAPACFSCDDQVNCFSCRMSEMGA